MGKKLKFKLLGPDPVYEDDNYLCKLCKEIISETMLETHAKDHKRNTYMVEIDIKKEKTDGTNLFRSV